MTDTTMNTGAASLSDEQLDDILNEHWNYQGVPRVSHIIDAMRAAISVALSIATPQADAAPDRCYAPGCHQWDGTSTCTCAAIAAGGAQEPDVFEWLETELSAISCRYHGDPSYDHDAYWMKDRVMKLIADARKAFPLPREAATVATSEADVKPVNGIPATLRHDEGAIACCSYCGRYSLDPKTLSDRQPKCDCGEQHGWSGSFKKPEHDAKWSGASPQAAPLDTGASKPGVQDEIAMIRYGALRDAENIARLFDLGTPDGHAIADSIRKLAEAERAGPTAAPSAEPASQQMELTPREIAALKDLKTLTKHRHFAIRATVDEAWPIIERLVDAVSKKGLDNV